MRIRSLCLAIIIMFMANTSASGSVLITDSGNHRVVEVDKKGNILWQFGISEEAGDDEYHLNFPSKAMRLPDRSTMIVDTENRRIIFVNENKEIIDVAGPHTGSMVYPVDAVFLNRELWVVDEHGERIMCWQEDTWRPAITKISEPNGKEMQFLGLSSLAAASGDNFYITDKDSDRVWLIDRKGQAIRLFGRDDKGLPIGPMLNRPQSVFIEDKDYVYIVDTDNSRIIKCNSSGNGAEEPILGGSRGCGPGQLNEPTSVQKLDNGLMVCEKLNHRVSIFDASGNSIWRYGDNYQPGSGPGLLKEPTYAAAVPADLEYHRQAGIAESKKPPRKTSSVMLIWAALVLTAFTIAAWPAARSGFGRL